MAFIRSFLKSGALTLLAAYGWLRIRFSNQPTLLILTYHRILPSDAPERAAEQPGMLTTPEALEEHIRFARKLGAELIHLNEWLERNEKGEKLPHLSVAFTFDDGWRDNYQYAYPKLKAQNAPATIFLVTRMIGTDKTFWPEQVLSLVTTKAIPDNAPAFEWLRPYLPTKSDPGGNHRLSLLEADEVVAQLKSLEDATIIDSLEKVYESHPELAPTPTARSILNSSELTEMSQDGLVMFGAHTRHHFRLNRLKDEKTLKEEIVDCLDDLRRLGKSAIPVFCYPNGNITGKGQNLVSSTYKAACTTKTGWNHTGCNPYDLRRFNLHDGNSHSKRALLATIGRGLL
ncbi:Polysaccharide deacetylase [Marinobacter sp. es.042]|uniref:polysaccharide deacetylase family protein n=1 Tax=Marinobacter sp. es.042 TaxID=1761794 RepID=UPI000B5F1864|nr:polysaccharide deacetylase family protein [Marinobacter sp. es.042]SNB55497.1 Polysaccharide deacetylase [Marinobacter sp. es.042]